MVAPAAPTATPDQALALTAQEMDRSMGATPLEMETAEMEAAVAVVANLRGISSGRASRDTPPMTRSAFTHEMAGKRKS